MKKTIFILFFALSLAACKEKELTVDVKNETDYDRKNETVTVDWNTVTQKLALKGNDQIIVLNSSSEQVPYQCIFEGKETPQALIFQVDILAKSTGKYTIKKGKPETFTAYTTGRYVPERLDDFAWENDRIAFRMYGPGLKGKITNGVDVWLKKTDKLIMDKFYHDELQNGLSYHEDHGEGLDCYSVGWTLGAGGVAPYSENKLWVGKPYSSYQVLDKGPLRTTFSLTYDSVQVGDKIIQQTLIISLDAHSQLNKGVVTYSSPIDTVAAGIALHEERGNLLTDIKNRCMAYAEKTTIDPNHAKKVFVPEARQATGHLYTGVVLPNGVDQMTQNTDHTLALAKYSEPFVYYFGAGWSNWGFSSDEQWFEYVKDFSHKLQHPLIVTVH